MAIVNGQTYWNFDPTEDVVSDIQEITAGLWSGGSGTLTALYTSGVQSASSGQYYLDIYNVVTSSATVTPEVQFSVAYGHKFGSGSLILNAQYPSRAIYSQYKNVLLEPTDEYFTINGFNKVHVLVMNFNLDRIKQKVDPGNWQFSVSGTNGEYYTFIDDSGQTSSPTIGKSGRVFNIVSGTIAAGPLVPNVIYGLAYPDMGIFILDPDKLALSASCPYLNNQSGSEPASNVGVNAGNHVWLIGYMNNAMITGSKYFIARNAENISSTHYFVRVKNAAFNFSNNPTFVTGTLGDLYNQDMVKNPTVYITTVGMYNNNNELLAVAKLSQPLKKNFNNESLIRVKLDY